MPVIHALKRPLETKDLREAIFEALTVWRMCQTTADTRAHLFVFTSHRDAIRAMTEVLPPDARGFEPLGSTENLTAREALTRTEAEPAAKLDMSWSGDIVPLLSPEAFESLLTRLRNLKPDPLRRTAVNLRVSGIRWSGASASSTGSFHLSDDKVFNRKIRFRIEMIHEAAEVLSRAAMQTEFAAVLAATGIDFSQGQRTVSRPIKETVAASADTDLATPCLLFDHCVEVLSDELKRSDFDWRTLTGVFSDGDGVTRRFHAGLLPKPSPFRWETTLNQFIKSALPAFKKESGLIDDAHSYLAPLDERWRMALVIDTHPGRRIGRVFKLRCGVVAADKTEPRFRRTAPMLRCEGSRYSQHHDWCPEFSFNDEAEFAAILASLGRFLSDFLRRFERLVRTVFLPGLENLSSVLPETRPFTAHEAYEAACAFAREAGKPTDRLIHVELSDTLKAMGFPTNHVAQMSTDGRAERHHGWNVTFAADDKLFIVTIPYAGRVSISTTPIMLDEERIGGPIEGRWLNSDAAAQHFFAKRDELTARYPDMAPHVRPLKLRAIEGRPAWLSHISFSARGEQRGWVLITHAIDAQTGERLGTTFDERFEHRSRNREVFTEGDVSLDGVL